MPKPSTAKDSRLLENIACTFTRAVETESSVLEIARIGMIPAQIYTSEETMGRDINFGATELRKRWMLLKQEARKQTFEVLHAEHLFLLALGMDAEEMAGHIRNSGIIGRQFGRLSASAPRGMLSDEQAIKEMIAEPQDWFAYNVQLAQVDFSAVAKERMQQAYSPRLGCPALANTVECGGKPVNLYDAYWSFFADNFAQAYVLDGGAYTRLTVSQPND